MEDIWASFKDGKVSRPFLLNDSKEYVLIREPIEGGERQEYSYALVNKETGNVETPYLSDGGIRIILARRNDDTIKRCPDCDGTGDKMIGSRFAAVGDCPTCEGRGNVPRLSRI